MEVAMGGLIVPTMRYRDAKQMIDWLTLAFGFQQHMVVEDENGGIAHAQLTYGNSMVMLGTARDDEFGNLQSSPDALGGTTQSPYIVVADADVVHERVKAMGAEIVIDIKDEGYGGRGFTCRDPEGQLWNVGTYDPWQA